MGRRKRATKGSSSFLMLLILASALLAFIPARVTLAVGKSPLSIFVDADILMALSGTHASIDSLGILINTHFAATLLTQLLYNQATGTLCLLGTSGGTCQVGYPLRLTDYFAVKIDKVMIDIVAANGSLTGLLPPYGGGPTFTEVTGQTSQTCIVSCLVDVRIVLYSVTIAGYAISPTWNTTSPYGDLSLSGLNPQYTLSFDRFFMDFIIDPSTNIVTYVASADMTAYQAFAVVVEAVSFL